MRISKEAATSIARQLLLKKTKAVEDMQLQYRQACTDAYKKQIPKAVYDFKEKFPQYVNQCTNLRLNGYGFNLEAVQATEKVVQEINSNYNNVELTKELAERDIIRHNETLKKIEAGDTTVYL